VTSVTPATPETPVTPGAPATGTTTFTDSDLSALLLAVGAEPPAGPETFGRTFAELDLDSLARTEIATRIKARWGTDVEAGLGPESTPAELRRAVTGR
jgi:minimal PKS acyl carrier protein